MLPLVAVLVLGVFAQQTFADEPEAIVGGIKADPGQFPYQVSLRYRGSHICSGTIVSKRCIVTAAHCLYDKIESTSEITVVAGILSISGGVERAVKTAAIHPYYSPSTMNLDVAVLVLAQPLEFNAYIKPIALSTRAPEPGTWCVLTGWGKTGANLPPSPVLLVTNVRVIDNESCRNSHGHGALIGNAEICTFISPRIGACQGDGGGPLNCGGTVAGIVSWGYLCATGLPDVYCNIAAITDFILPYL